MVARAGCVGSPVPAGWRRERPLAKPAGMSSLWEEATLDPNFKERVRLSPGRRRERTPGRAGCQQGPGGQN